jgi:hypothetical protein
MMLSKEGTTLFQKNTRKCIRPVELLEDAGYCGGEIF